MFDAIFIQTLLKCLKSFHRIFKKLTNNHAEIAHDEHKADELYTVKLSIYVKKRIQQSDASKHQNIVKLTKFGRKADIVQKVEISSATILKEYCGWIEFSVPSLRKHWDSPSKNLGLAVDIYDSSNRQLTAKDHFSLQSCEEGKCVECQLTIECNNTHRIPLINVDIIIEKLENFIHQMKNLETTHICASREYHDVAYKCKFLRFVRILLLFLLPRTSRWPATGHRREELYHFSHAHYIFSLVSARRCNFASSYQSGCRKKVQKKEIEEFPELRIFVHRTMHSVCH